MSSKLRTLPEIIKTAERWRKARQKIVFTNGCFDLLHVGHVRYLEQAKAKGDVLIIGLNSDSSVQKIKGPNRPITSQAERAEILSALAAVDAIVIFDEPTPQKLIEAVLPDVLVKGGDWDPKDIVGADSVKKRGGEVLSLDFVGGHSTSSLIRRIVEKSK